MNPLQAYLAKSPKTTQHELATQCGLSRSYIAEILSGTKMPGRDAIAKIDAGTKGEVPASAWFASKAGAVA